MLLNLSSIIIFYTDYLLKGTEHGKQDQQTQNSTSV